MSFVNKRITLEGNPHKQPLHKFRTCSKCSLSRAPEGGVEMGPSKWYCAECWTLRSMRSPRKGNK